MWVEGGFFHTETHLHDMASRLCDMIRWKMRKVYQSGGVLLVLNYLSLEGTQHFYLRAIGESQSQGPTRVLRELESVIDTMSGWKGKTSLSHKQASPFIPGITY